MSQLHPNPESEPPPSNDMRVLLIISGIIVFLSSLGCLGIGGFYTFFLPGLNEATEGAGALSRGLGVSMGLLFATMAVGIGWLGIGSMLCRKWARDILYAGGWLIAVFVGIGVIGMLFLIPTYLKIFGTMPTATGGAGASTGTSMGSMGWVMVLSMVIGVGIYLIPAVYLILIYGLSNVRRTVRHRNPEPGWTDRMPIPVLALWLALAWGALGFASMAPAYGEALVEVGLLSSPVVAGLIFVILGGVFGGLAWATTRLTPTSWWVLLSGLVVTVLCWFGFMAMVDMPDLMNAMNAEMSGDPGMATMQTEMNETLYGDKTAFLIPVSIMFAGLIGYLVWLRRYFVTPSASNEA